MEISGFIKVSLQDYPGKIASVIFTQGCNWRCYYCHNKQLIPIKKGLVNEAVVLGYLADNAQLLDGVVITGGEPTMQADLFSFIQRIRQLHLSVKLDTNGSNPGILRRLLEAELIHYVAMDIKTVLTPHSYSQITGISFDDEMIEDVVESVKIIQSSGVQHEFRTTICRRFLNTDAIRSICESILLNNSVSRYILQQCCSKDTEYTTRELLDIAKELSDYPIELRSFT